MSLLKCLLKMTKNLKCLQVHCSTKFVVTNKDSDEDSRLLTVSDLPSSCEMVRLIDDYDTTLEEFSLVNKRFVF